MLDTSLEFVSPPATPKPQPITKRKKKPKASNTDAGLYTLDTSFTPNRTDVILASTPIHAGASRQAMSSDGVAMVSGTPVRGGGGDDAGALSGVEAAEAMLSLASGTNLTHSTVLSQVPSLDFKLAHNFHVKIVAVDSALTRDTKIACVLLCDR